MPLPAAFLPAALFFSFAAPGAPPAAARPADAPRAQVRLAVQLTRTDDGAPPRVIGAPVLTTLEGGTGSISVSGGDISYSVSLSPNAEANNNVALLWNLQLSGKALPGATSVNLSGASRVAAGKEEPVAEVTLKDPKTGRQSSFRLLVTTVIARP